MVKRCHFIEIGTVCCINYGPNAGKICVVLDVMDSNKVLADGPTSGVERGLVSLRHLSITPIKVQVPRGAKTATLDKLMKKQEIDTKWSQTSWAKKLAKQATRANLSDFDRFKVMCLRKKRSTVVGKALAKLKKAK
eukprot:CAMPEP_0175093454 /NCGR_PEP_ID=MMETSP0086_2-20121207/3026_1 /TAXON_ID=136419 /ORGANISM="Unknown Unknown, Strain D1" /LENGTH=135 /DNA_ID=CAMNT_0016366427 /DNA_START=27 /DNA_END=434 /DNA_ORIENTATION=-